MKAIILAAGFGYRMRPLTDNTHKTLLEIGNQTIIERILKSLISNGLKDVVIVTGYRDNELKSYLSSGFSELNLQYVHNPRYEETNNIYSLNLAFQSMTIDDDVMLIESDLVYEPSVIQRLLKAKGNNVALVDKFRSGMDGTVVTVSEGIVSNIIPPHLQGAEFDFSDKYKSLNIYKFSRDFCNTTFKKLLNYYTNAFDDNCFYELILGILIYVQKETIHAEILNGEKWTEIDDPNDLALAKYMFDVDHQLEVLEHGWGGLWNHDILDFCYIRNMYFPNSSILAELKNNLTRVIYNYGSRQEALNQKLAYFLLFNPKNLNLLNGASQIYPVFQKYLTGKKVLIPTPTFGEYPRMFGEKHTYSDKVGISTSEIEEKAEQCDAVVFVNPNNPTGSLIETEKIFDFALHNPRKTILVDESFIDFSSQPSIITFLEKKPLENIIVIKSLSKILGVPGLRLGYAYCVNHSFNTILKESIPIWNMNSLAEYFLEIILKHRKSLAQSYVNTIEDRKEFHAALSEVGFFDQVFPSGANFILAHFRTNTPNAKQIIKLLLSRFGIYVKDVSHKFGNEGVYLRLAVRLPKENEYLVKCLKETVSHSQKG